MNAAGEPPDPVSEFSQAAGRPSAARIVQATIAALLVATMVLVTAILPAEYGIDPLGTGKLLGLVELAQVRPGVLASQPDEYRTDSREFVLGPYQAVEYTYRIEKGGSMLFSWQATGTVRWNLHSQPDGAAQDYAESFDQREGSKAHGTYVAPFSGIHGWYWENVDKKDVRITLTTAGFYSGAQESFDGGSASHDVKDPRGNVVKRPQR